MRLVLHILDFLVKHWEFSIALCITIFFGFITLFGWILPRRARLRKEEEKRLQQIEKQSNLIPSIERDVKEMHENLKVLKERSDAKPYIDGLDKAPPLVFDPFAKALKLMAEYKWDKAIDEFKKSMKEAKASQLVALYNLIGICYYTPGKLELTLENWSKSLSLAKEFTDREGESVALGNLGNVYKFSGKLDKAIKYYEDALKIHKGIGNKEGEATGLNNLASVFETKGQKEKALKYYEDALRLCTQIGAQRQIEIIKGNVKRLKGE